MTTRGAVIVVDDDAGIRTALSRLLRAERFDVVAYESAEAFLAAPPRAGPICLVLDVAMPGVGGLEIQRRLLRRGGAPPIVFLTGRGDIPMSVQAIKSGASDFLTKPVDAAHLLAAVRAALAKSADVLAAEAETAALRERLERLTPREREVLSHVVAGKPNKLIATSLGTGEHTVKVHRGRVMEKLGARSVADLVRIADRLGVPPSP